MILIYVGTMGSGKTLSMVREAYNYYQQGYRILSNMNLNFDYEPISSVDIMNFAKKKTALYNTVILIDELHIFMDSRRAVSKKNLMSTYFITQTRKQKVKLLGTTQHRHQIDRRVRDNTDCFIDCEKVELPLLYKGGKEILLIINHVNTRKRYEKVSFVGNPYFNLYDTEEIIMDLGEEENEKVKDDKLKGDE
jgi:hypothetical protein